MAQQDRGGAAFGPRQGRVARPCQGERAEPVIRLLADQNFNGHILGGLARQEPALDVLHVRDVGLDEAPDPTILEWAAENDRVLLTHDRRTIPTFAHDRVVAGRPMSGVFLVRDERMSTAGKIHGKESCSRSLLDPESARDIVRYFPM